MEGIILGLGNPLLDISANVPEEYLTKYGLTAGSAILADEAKHSGLYADLCANFEVEYIAGGATQNTMRGIQWMLKGEKWTGATGYVGCVGTDEYGTRLESAAKKDGVNVQYMKKEGVPTGTCGVLVVKKDRSLVANLGAANCYSIDHINAHWALVEKARFFYSAGFFLTVAPDAALKVAKHAAETGKIYATNLSAPFIVQFFWDGKLSAVLPYVDILFGNDDEARAVATAQGWPLDLEEIARRLAALPSEKATPRRVVITCGASPVITCCGSELEKFEVPAVDFSAVVDTNGAGDCFVAGFMSQLIQGKPLKTCIDAGNYCASYIIKRSGITFGEPSKFE